MWYKCIARKRQQHKLNPEKFSDPDREDDADETNPILKCLRVGNKGDSKEAREAEEIARQNYDPLKSIQENKTWNIVANVLAVLSIELFVFLNAYYAWNVHNKINERRCKILVLLLFFIHFLCRRDFENFMLLSMSSCKISGLHNKFQKNRVLRSTIYFVKHVY